MICFSVWRLESLDQGTAGPGCGEASPDLQMVSSYGVLTCGGQTPKSLLIRALILTSEGSTLRT